MNELVKLILSLSLSGSLIILVLFLWKPLVKNKLSKKWQYYIWLIAIGCLLLPFAPETSLMEMLFQHLDKAIMETDISPVQKQSSPSLAEENIEEYSKDISSQKESSNSNLAEKELLPEQSLFELALENIGISFLFIWLMAAIGLLIRKITIYQSFVKYIMAGRIEISDMELWERAGKLLEQSGIKTPVGLYTNSLISSPLLVGLFRPCIMLPTAHLPESDFQYTILHELMHYKRKDMLYKWLVQAAICLRWFNPLVFLMGREINRAGELSCDEAFIEHLDFEERRAYGSTLVNAMGMGGLYKDSVASIPLNESTKLLKERLNAIMGYKKKTKLTALISVTLAVTLLFGAGAAGAYGAPDLQGFHVNMDKEIPSAPSDTYLEPQKAGKLKLVRKEYTISDLKALDISGIAVEALYEDVLITTGGKTLKLEYYTGKQDDYTLQTEQDGGGKFQELVLRRVNSAVMEGVNAPVTLTIPDNINFRLISAETASGNISLENCSGRYVFSETKSGNIIINKGMVDDMLKVRTDSGNALIMGTNLPGGGIRHIF